MNQQERNLFDVTIRRTYTDEYMARWPSKKSTDTIVQSWASSIEEVREYWTKLHAPGQFQSFDRMYQDSVVHIEQVEPEDLAERRKRLQTARVKICCDLAIQRNCVCSYSTQCPVHGVRCHGTHD